MIAVPATLQLPLIVVDSDALGAAETREPFDQLGYEMLARSGRMSEQVIAGVERASAKDGLDLDQAVVGGLLVRASKLLRGVFDATQADESEAHLALSRCAAETAITLRWLVTRGDQIAFRRFRADSFAYLRRQLDKMRAEEPADEVQEGLAERVERSIEGELRAAGVTWDDVPQRPNSWGPDLRQRCDALDQSWVYESFFSSHHNYVHPSWHELRAFHLDSSEGRLVLDPTYGGMAPIAGYVLARLVAEACGDAAGFLPCDLDAADVAGRVQATVEASQALSIEFGEFIARGGLDAGLERHA
jgi:Family of unknown function (DUF5677)